MKKRCAAIFLTAFLTLCGCGENDGYGGEFNAVIADNPENLDPQIASDKESCYIIRNIYGTLTDIDDSGMIVCGTAESYSVSEDGLTYTFKLREGLNWYGNSVRESVPLTAYDYEYAFRRIYDSSTHSPYVELFSNIRNSLAVYGEAFDAGELGVKAVGEYELVITLEKPDCDFLKLMAHSAASPCNEQLFLSTEGRYGLSAEYTFSCGAFYVADWNYDPYWTDNHIELIKINSNSLPGYETYPASIYIEITDDRAAFEKNNNVSVDSYAIDSAEQYTKDVEREYICNEYITGTTFFFISPQSPIFNDESSRKAVLAAVSEAEIGDNLSVDSISATGFIPPAITVMNKSFRDIYPNTKAKLTGERDYWDKFVTEHKDIDFNSSILLVSDEISSQTIAYTLVNELEDKLELYCTPVFENQSVFESRVCNEDYTFGITVASSDYNSASFFFEELVGYLSEEMYSELDMDSLYRADISSKSQSIERIDTLIIENAYAVPLTYEKQYFLCSENVTDLWYDPFTEAVFYKYAKK